MWLTSRSVRRMFFGCSAHHHAPGPGAAPPPTAGVDCHYLVLDGAGWHTSAVLMIPDGIDLVWLPPVSPELQTAERLWPLVDKPTANRISADLDEP